MTEYPIIFSGDSPNAILLDRKTQTRRVMKLRDAEEECCWCKGKGYEWIECENELSGYDYRRPCRCRTPRCPYGKAGDVLWVREAWAAHRIYNAWRPRELAETASIWYRAGGEGRGLGNRSRPELAGRWRSPRFMPKWACRLRLEVLEVRVERVQEISDADCQAEGMDSSGPPALSVYHEKFMDLWDKLNAKRGYPWELNPWVWAILFRRIK